MEDMFHLGVKACIVNHLTQLLVLKKHPGKKFTWDLPGGRMNPDEKMEDALRREVFEETGLKIDPKSCLKMDLSNIRIPVGDLNVGLVIALYSCSWKEGQKIQLSFEHVDFEWMSIDKASKLLEEGFSETIVDSIRSIR